MIAVLIIIMSILCLLMEFALIYGIAKNKISKFAIIAVVYIGLCIIASIFFKNPLYFSYLGILGVVLLILSKVKNRK